MERKCWINGISKQILYSTTNHSLLKYQQICDFANLTEVFPCFFLGCKANARV